MHRHAKRSTHALARHGKEVLVPLIFLAIATAAFVFSLHAQKPFASAEVKFTDASKSGLAIVPASCPSTPDYPGQCDGGTTPTPPNPSCPVNPDPAAPPSVCPPITWTCSDGTPAPNNDVNQCPRGPVLCPDGSAALNGDLSKCPATPNPTLCPNGSVAPGGNLSQCPGGPVCLPGQCGPGGPGGCGGAGCTVVNNACPLGYVQQGNFCVFNACPLGYVQQGNFCVFNACPTGFQLQGNQCVQIACSPHLFCSAGQLYYGDQSSQYCADSAVVQDSCGGWGCSGSACNAVPSASIVTWNVSPVLVQSGTKVEVKWSAQNVRSCTVSNSVAGGDSWTTTSGDEMSSPITGQTIYTILCQGYAGASPASVTRSTTVNIIPVFEEQ